jgi:hypothetical protein
MSSGKVYINANFRVQGSEFGSGINSEPLPPEIEGSPEQAPKNLRSSRKILKHDSLAYPGGRGMRSLPDSSLLACGAKKSRNFPAIVLNQHNSSMNQEIFRI